MNLFSLTVAISNNVLMNTEMQMSLYHYGFSSLGLCPEIGLFDHMAVLYLIFLGLSILFSMAAALFCKTVRVSISYIDAILCYLFKIYN